MKIAHRRPYVSLRYGTNGSAQISPRLYAEEIMPRSAPLGSLKSNLHQHQQQTHRPTASSAQPTSLPRRCNLHRINHLRIEARRHFNPDTRRQQQSIEPSQILLPIPWRLIPLYHARQHRVRLPRSSSSADARHSLCSFSFATRILLRSRSS